MAMQHGWLYGRESENTYSEVTKALKKFGGWLDPNKNVTVNAVFIFWQYIALNGT